MFDIGWFELLLIGIVALIVVGPEDLPGMFRTVGRFVGRARGMAREFQRSMEDAADESGLKDAAKGLDDLRSISDVRPTNMAKNYAKKTVLGDDDQQDVDETATDNPSEAEKTTVADASAKDPT